MMTPIEHVYDIQDLPEKIKGAVLAAFKAVSDSPHNGELKWWFGEDCITEDDSFNEEDYEVAAEPHIREVNQFLMDNHIPVECRFYCWW